MTNIPNITQEGTEVGGFYYDTMMTGVVTGVRAAHGTTYLITIEVTEASHGHYADRETVITYVTADGRPADEGITFLPLIDVAHA